MLARRRRLQNQKHSRHEGRQSQTPPTQDVCHPRAQRPLNIPDRHAVSGVNERWLYPDPILRPS